MATECCVFMPQPSTATVKMQMTVKKLETFPKKHLHATDDLIRSHHDKYLKKDVNPYIVQGFKVWKPTLVGASYGPIYHRNPPLTDTNPDK